MLRRILFSACLCLFLAPVAKADHFSLTGTVTGSFNGEPFSASTSLQGVNFIGGAFTLQSIPGDPFGRIGLAGSIGSLSYTNINGLTGRDTFAVRLLFDPAHAANPPEMIFTFTMFVNPETNVIVLLGDFRDPSITFVTEGIFVIGDFGLDFVNLTPNRPISEGRGFVRFVNQPHPIPEPATLLLFGGALIGLTLRLWRTH